jgi:hypothetical protein
MRNCECSSVILLYSSPPFLPFECPAQNQSFLEAVGAIYMTCVDIALYIGGEAGC